ncbi:MAG: hypothetical protein EOO43_08285 [Flavobacterium sp.]|nr:MAG: hypothetical protein EOO43_08285 [Flavobacterium sp.]
MKAQARTQKTAQPQTQFVVINEQQVLVNSEVQKAYNLIVDAAIEQLRKFDLVKYRTYATVDHLKNEYKSNMISEHLNYFWNITLSNSKEGKSYIFIDLGGEALERFGNGLTNHFLRKAYEITESNDNTVGIEYALRINFKEADQHHNFFYRRVAEGENNYVSIATVDKLES